MGGIRVLQIFVCLGFGFFCGKLWNVTPAIGLQGITVFKKKLKIQQKLHLWNWMHLNSTPPPPSENPVLTEHGHVLPGVEVPVPPVGPVAV